MGEQEQIGITIDVDEEAWFVLDYLYDQGYKKLTYEDVQKVQEAQFEYLIKLGLVVEVENTGE